MFVSKTFKRFVRVNVAYSVESKRFESFPTPRKATILGVRGNMLVIRVSRSDFSVPSEYLCAR